MEAAVPRFEPAPAEPLPEKPVAALEGRRRVSKVRFRASPRQLHQEAFGRHVATPIMDLACSSCGHTLSSRGMLVRLVADVATTMYSTDVRPTNTVALGVLVVVPGQCDCQVQDFACLCGLRTGYEMVQPCASCMMTQEDGGHRWFLSSRCVSAVPRRDEHGELQFWPLSDLQGSSPVRADRIFDDFASPLPVADQENLGSAKWSAPHGAVPPLPYGLSSDGEDAQIPRPLSEMNGRDILRPSQKLGLSQQKPAFDSHLGDIRSREARLRDREERARWPGERSGREALSAEETLKTRIVIADAMRQVQRALSEEPGAEGQAAALHGTQSAEEASRLLLEAEALRDQVHTLCDLVASKRAVLQGASASRADPEGPEVRAGRAALESARLGVQLAHMQARAARAAVEAAKSADRPPALASDLQQSATEDAFVEARLQCAQRLVEKREALAQWQDALEERELLLCEAERVLEDSRGVRRLSRPAWWLHWLTPSSTVVDGSGTPTPPLWQQVHRAFASQQPAGAAAPQATSLNAGPVGWFRQVSGCGKRRTTAGTAEWSAPAVPSCSSCPRQ